MRVGVAAYFSAEVSKCIVKSVEISEENLGADYFKESSSSSFIDVLCVSVVLDETAFSSDEFRPVLILGELSDVSLN